MDHFPMKTKYKRSKPGRVIRINQAACDALEMLGDKYVIESISQTVSDMILFCAERVQPETEEEQDNG